MAGTLRVPPILMRSPVDRMAHRHPSLFTECVDRNRFGNEMFRQQDG